MTAHAQGLLDRINAAPLPRVAPRVIGIDLSLTCTGLSDGFQAWCHPTHGRATDDLTARDDRLRRITDTVMAYVSPAVRTNLVVLEGPSHNSRHGNAWDRAGLWWRLVHRLLAQDVPLAVAPPACRAKYATGKGNAGKDAVLLAASRRWPDCPISNNNEADALVLAQMGLDWLGRPTVPMPATHKAALTGVAWPERPTGELPPDA